MDRPRVRRSVRIGVVPDEQTARTRFERNAEPREGRGAAFLHRVEIGHRGDRALPAALLFLRPIGGAAGEPVAVRLELLPGQITLALDRLPVPRVDPEQVVEPALDLADERIVRVDIARVRGAIAALIS